jgi:hypothetical protein
VSFYGRAGGVVPTVEEIISQVELLHASLAAA